MTAPSKLEPEPRPSPTFGPLLRSLRRLGGTLRGHGVAAVLLAAMALLLIASMQDESPTTDEPMHLTRGLAYFWGPDASLSYSHPPLGNAFAALPSALLHPRVDVGALDGYREGEVWTVARRLLGVRYAERRAWFFEARAMIALSCLALGIYVYRRAGRLFGPQAAIWALLFFVFHPTLIAHGRLVTTDMPVTVAMTIAAGELTAFLIGGARWHGAAAALAVGVGLVTKYTGLLMVPLASFAVLVTAATRLGRYRGLSVRRALAAAAGFLLVAAAVSLLVVNAAYRFERTGLEVAELLEAREPAPEIESRGFGGRVLETSSPLPGLPAWIRIPLPYTYVFGISVLRAHGSQGHPTTFFGVPRAGGHPAYFPLMLAIKTPLALLCALGYAAILAVGRRGRVGLAAWLLAGYVAGVLLIAMRASINIGVRHVLPVIPVLCVLGGAGCARGLATFADARLRARVAVVAIASLALGTAWSFPDYLSDFNLLVGGRWGGERISIVGEEWGQDTARLGRALRERDVRRVHLAGSSFITRLELQRHGVRGRRLPCGEPLPADAWIAVRARDLARKRDDCTKWAHERDPVFDVNRHVFVYRTGGSEH